MNNNTKRVSVPNINAKYNPIWFGYMGVLDNLIKDKDFGDGVVHCIQYRNVSSSGPLLVQRNSEHELRGFSDEDNNNYHKLVMKYRKSNLDWNLPLMSTKEDMVDVESVTVIHHTDLDGYCSAANVSMIHRRLNSAANLQLPTIGYYTYNYSGFNDLIDRKISSDVNIFAAKECSRLLYVVDLSLKKGELKKLAESGLFSKIIWIDHHDTSINSDVTDEFISSLEKETGVCISYYLDSRESAAYWTSLVRYDALNGKGTSDWARINDGKDLIHNYGPEYYKDLYFRFINNNLYLSSLVSRYDTKQSKPEYHDDIEYSEGVWLNQFFMDTDLLQPTSNLWQQMAEDGQEKRCYNPVIKEVVDNAGKELFSAYLKKIETLSNFVNTFKYSSSVLDSMLKTEEEKGISILGLIGRGNSQRFYYMKEADNAIMMLAHLKDPYNFTLSAYTDLDNVVPIGRVFRKYFGGGGHPKAAGFTVSTEWMVALNACWDLMFDFIKENKDFDEVKSLLETYLDGYPCKKAWMDMFTDIYQYDALFSDYSDILFGFEGGNIENKASMVLTDFNLKGYLQVAAKVLFYEMISNQFK